MKNKLGLIITTVVLAIFVVVGVLLVKFIKPEEEELQFIDTHTYTGSDTTYKLENDDLLFELSSENTQFTLTNKKTKQVWYSNPQDTDSDALAVASEKNRLKSQVVLTWSTKYGLDTVYDNYNFGMENHNYEITQTDDGIRVDYTIGSVEKTYIIPPAITAENMEAMLAQLSKSEAAGIKDYYKKYDINKLGKKDNKEELLERYPILETEPIYVIRDAIKDPLKVKMEALFEVVGYTLEDWERDIALDTAASSNDKPAYNVSVIYRLKGKDLVVECPLADIEYKKDFPIYNLTLLPYFGAANSTEEGYMLVPEGGGAIIDFNNGKLNSGNFYANLYGWDYAVERKDLVRNTEANFNAFGVAKEGGSFICTIEDGASYAAVKANIAGISNSYNVINAETNIIHRSNYEMADRSTNQIFMYEDKLPNESLIQTYHIIDGNSYVDMAMEYRSYLEEKYGADLTASDSASTPVSVEILGAIDKIKQVLGVPKQMPHKLTTFKEASEITSELKDSGISNLSVKYSGWMNGGYEHKLLKNTKLVSDLGSKKDLTSFINTAKDAGVTVYLDGSSNYAFNSDITDGFLNVRDSAKFPNKDRAKLYKYSTIFYKQMKWLDPYYLLKPELVNDMADKLTEQVSKYNAGVSFRDYGSDLSADYNKKAVVSREAVRNTQTDKIKEYSASMPVMLNKGRDYDIAYADIVTNMDLKGTNYTLIDRFVPFYQMAIHGYVDYTGAPINLAQDYEEELLASAEYGAGLSFTFMNASAFELQTTFYTDYFGADYREWKDRAIDIYTNYNNELGATFNQKMTNHEKLSDTLSCTMYEDGTKVYVNYGYEDVKVNGETIPARYFKAVK